jgi:baseplate J-like protein
VSCDCDITVVPEPLAIPAGLIALPRQIAMMPEWRRAILEAIGRETALDDWAAREPHDLGVMLVDLWAYVCDVISFYDAATADEGYLRTAALRPSRRRLVGLLGYVPRPAVAAAAVLAAIAEGRQTVKLTAGTAFRSTSFSGQPPQVFELGADTLIHPLNNKWPVARVVPTELDPAHSTTSIDGVTVVPGTLRAAPGGLVAIIAGSTKAVRTIARIDTVATLSRRRFLRLVFSSSVTLPGSTTYASLDVRRPTARAGVWTLGAASGEEAAVGTNTLILDGLHRGLSAGQDVIIAAAGSYSVNTITSINEQTRVLLTGLTSSIKNTGGTVTGSIVSPDIKLQITRVTLAQNLPGGADAATTSVWYGLASAGRVVALPKDTLSPLDPILLSGVLETPPIAPGELMLLDHNSKGVHASGQIDFSSNAVTLASDATWSPDLSAPITLYGNAPAVTRGQSVRNETIGVGNSALPFQTFKLAKKPLTYLASDGAGALRSTLDIHVDGIRWTERPTFYGAGEHDRIFVVRADDDESTLVTFGGGARLPTGSRVVADYRFGAGAASPPANTVTQVARPVKGLKSVNNPLAAYGGADREGPAELLAYAPRSALLLGRAISLLDFEAAAAGVPGVRAVAAEWRFSDVAQRPLVHIYFIGDSQLHDTILQKLQGLSDPTVPIVVEPATPDTKRIDLAITVSPDYTSSIVRNAVRDGLFAAATTPGTGGLLRPERLGVGKPLFESRISEVVVNTAGVQSLDQILYDTAASTSYGILPAAGHYLDFESGAVVINGSASYV